jgi:transposase
MVKAYPEEFRRDVIAVARTGETSVRQVAKDFGISETCLARWLRPADRDDGNGSAASPSAKAVEQAELLCRAFRLTSLMVPAAAASLVG